MSEKKNISKCNILPVFDTSYRNFSKQQRQKSTMTEQIYKFDTDQVWFTSDTHFGHENIIRYCGRPFRNAEEMNAELIRRWRETVPDDGIVFHLGDFAHGGSRL